MTDVARPAGADAFDHPVASRTRLGTPRVAALDITRAIALVGVVVMNYHGYLNGDTNRTGALDRLFDIDSGILSTRFAAVFVLIAGVSVSLLTNTSRTSGDSSAIRHDRVRLVRRGLILLVAGVALEHAWSGTIIFYYGVYLVIAAWIFTVSRRWLIALGATTLIATTTIHVWESARNSAGHSTAWLHPQHPNDPREWLLRAVYDHTHPLLPWLAFLCAGMVIGRELAGFTAHARRIAERSMGVVIALYVVSALLDGLDARRSDVVHTITSMRPFSGGLFYSASTLAIAIAVFAAVTLLCENNNVVRAVSALQRAGQMTLSLYLLHVVVYYAATTWTTAVTPGLANAVLLALSFWVVALAAAAWWHHRIGRGPAEWLYRRLGG